MNLPSPTQTSKIWTNKSPAGDEPVTPRDDRIYRHLVYTPATDINCKVALKEADAETLIRAIAAVKRGEGFAGKTKLKALQSRLNKLQKQTQSAVNPLFKVGDQVAITWTGDKPVYLLELEQGDTGTIQTVRQEAGIEYQVAFQPDRTISKVHFAESLIWVQEHHLASTPAQPQFRKKQQVRHVSGTFYHMGQEYKTGTVVDLKMLDILGYGVNFTGGKLANAWYKAEELEPIEVEPAPEPVTAKIYTRLPLALSPQETRAVYSTAREETETGWTLADLTGSQWRSALTFALCRFDPEKPYLIACQNLDGSYRIVHHVRIDNLPYDLQYQWSQARIEELEDTIVSYLEELPLGDSHPDDREAIERCRREIWDELHQFPPQLAAGDCVLFYRDPETGQRLPEQHRKQPQTMAQAIDELLKPDEPPKGQQYRAIVESVSGSQVRVRPAGLKWGTGLLPSRCFLKLGTPEPLPFKTMPVGGSVPDGAEVVVTAPANPHYGEVFSVDGSSLLGVFSADDRFFKHSELGYRIDEPPAVTCPSCNAELLRLEDGCGVCGWTQTVVTHQDPEGDRSSPLPAPPGCWMESYVVKKRLANGDRVPYTYYRMKAYKPIFENNNGKPTRSLHLGTAASAAYKEWSQRLEQRRVSKGVAQVRSARPPDP